MSGGVGFPRLRGEQLGRRASGAGVLREARPSQPWTLTDGRGAEQETRGAGPMGVSFPREELSVEWERAEEGRGWGGVCGSGPAPRVPLSAPQLGGLRKAGAAALTGCPGSRLRPRGNMTAVGRRCPALGPRR